MLATTLLAAAALASSALLEVGDPLRGEIQLVNSNVGTFDPNTFTAAPPIDVYHLLLYNDTDFNVTSLSLNLPGGPYVNNWAPGPITFRNRTFLPGSGPSDVAETFFVIPSPFQASSVLQVGTIDTSSVLASSFTLPGGPTLIGPRGSAVAAVLSVPTGTVLNTDNWTGFSGVPEPSAALLAACGLAAATGRRRE